MMETHGCILKIKEREARPQRKLMVTYQNVQDGRSSAGGETQRRGAGA